MVIAYIENIKQHEQETSEEIFLYSKKNKEIEKEI